MNRSPTLITLCDEIGVRLHQFIEVYNLLLGELEVPRADIAETVYQVNPATLSSDTSRGRRRRRGDGRRSSMRAITTVSSTASDCGPGEKCAICLSGIRNQAVGTPNCCNHTFCYTCLSEWAKSSNMCPMDRQEFTGILFKINKDEEVSQEIFVEEPILSSVYFDPIVCWTCGVSDAGETIMLCDYCIRGFHLFCLEPPLDAIPDTEEWICPFCIDEISREEEVRYMLPPETPRIQEETTPPPRRRSQRLLDRLARNS